LPQPHTVLLGQPIEALDPTQRGPFRAIVSKAPHGLVQPNLEGSRAANHVPKLEQSRAGRRYNPQAVAAADRNLAEMAHRLEAALRKPKMVADARGEGRAPPPVAAPASAPKNGVDAAAAEAASKPPRTWAQR
jgi:flagellar protein FliO/FliZ